MIRKIKINEEINIFLSIKEVNSDRSLKAKQISFDNDKSEPFSFENINIESPNGSIYFQLNLIADGEYITSVDSSRNPTFLEDWKKAIETTYFHTGESSWGKDLSEGNQYFFALPYRDYDFSVVDLEVNILSEEDYYGVSDVKNRWIEIYYPDQDNYVYAQWRDVGPWNIYDPYYVFEDQRPYAETGVDMGWSEAGIRETNKAGLDVSPEVMKALIGLESDGDPERGLIKTDWRFVDEEDVPDGPWKEEISTEAADIEIFNKETKTLRTKE